MMLYISNNNRKSQIKRSHSVVKDSSLKKLTTILDETSFDKRKKCFYASDSSFENRLWWESRFE